MEMLRFFETSSAYSRHRDKMFLANPSKQFQGVWLLAINLNHIKSYFLEVLMKMPHFFYWTLGFSSPTTEKLFQQPPP